MALKAIIATLILGTSSLALAAPGYREQRAEHRVNEDRAELRRDRADLRRDRRFEERVEARATAHRRFERENRFERERRLERERRFERMQQLRRDHRCW